MRRVWRALIPVAVAAWGLGLSGCREDEDKVVVSARATPTPTPRATASGQSEGIAFPEPTAPTADATPEAGATPTPSATTPTTGDSGGADEAPDEAPGAGAAMSAAAESVAVFHTISGGANAVLYVERANGEVWILNLQGSPAAAVGDQLVYGSESLVFGAADSLLVEPFAGGRTYRVRSASRFR